MTALRVVIPVPMNMPMMISMFAVVLFAGGGSVLVESKNVVESVGLVLISGTERYN